MDIQLIIYIVWLVSAIGNITIDLLNKEWRSAAGWTSCVLALIIILSSY